MVIKILYLMDFTYDVTNPRVPNFFNNWEIFNLDVYPPIIRNLDVKIWRVSPMSTIRGIIPFSLQPVMISANTSSG